MTRKSGSNHERQYYRILIVRDRTSHMSPKDERVLEENTHYVSIDLEYDYTVC